MGDTHDFHNDEEIMSFDTRCRDLAVVFASDEPGYAELSVAQRSAIADELAQDIQDQIEASLTSLRDYGRFDSTTTKEKR